MPFVPTEEQRLILEYDTSVHARILAGPGTGKSTTLVALLIELTQKKADLSVRMLTFTRATTAELAAKFAEHGLDVPPPSTIHSFAISLLLRNQGTGGFPEPLRIADDWEYKNIIAPMLADRIEVTQTYLKKLVQELASNWQALEPTNQPEVDEETRAKFVGAWYEHREIFGYTLLQELPYALRNALSENDGLKGCDFDLLLVDEYQDLNACDLEAIKLLSDKYGSKVVGTGDDDQSIYSWRNAAPAGIRRFVEDYEGAADYTLSQSLRCSQRIITWANYVIMGDPDRPRERGVLDPRAESPEGEVALLGFADGASEAEGVANLVQGLINDENVHASEILILTRADHNGTFSKPIRDALTARGIESFDPGFVSALLGEADNRILLELLKLRIDSDDSIAWASLLKLHVGVGDAFFSYVYEHARKSRTRFSSALRTLYEGNFPDGPASSRAAEARILELLTWLETVNIPEDEDTQWGQWIADFADGDAMSPPPTDEFRQLLIGLDAQPNKDRSLQAFVGQIEPRGKDLAQAKSEGVRIMTMGGSKGLTVKVTILAGVDDGLIPRPNADLAEERRVLYVAMTRATDILYGTWAQRRYGPTARAGSGAQDARQFCHFLRGGPVNTQAGAAFVARRFPQR